jgi:hypothetical protein
MAAPVWDVPAERIEVSSPAQKYRVLVTTDENRKHALTGIIVVWNGVEMKVPVHDLVGIEDVNVQSFRVVTDRPMRKPGLPLLNTRELAVTN